VADNGVWPLRGLPFLRKLRVHGTRVTAAGVRRLQDAIPGLEVVTSSDFGIAEEAS
jgi:hypothetical protein